MAQSDGSLLSTRSILVPSGLWYVQGGGLNLDNCLGAPFFEAADGASIYLGTFDLTSDKMSINMDTTSIGQALSGKPIKLVQAHWVNGYTYPCRQLSMYALEFDGFPFANGYQWGSRA
ncbi:hypothetical protein, partial [Asticcacaulis sp. W401b]|uniref:hypothetical protein n=1 Tax=Asticcacaulis sp. W401b TaxID=3388666 RepID=UPI0039704919